MEVLIVLAIAGFLTGMATLQFQSYLEHRRVKLAAQGVVSLIRRAQLESATAATGKTIDELYIIEQYDNTVATVPLVKKNDRRQDGVVLVQAAPFDIKNDGACTDGSVKLAYRNVSYILSIRAPLCSKMLQPAAFLD